jgi:hypothetical protein
MIPHRFNATTLLVAGVVCTVRLSPASPHFTGESVFTLCLLLASLASLWAWMLDYSRAQQKNRRRRTDLLIRAIYRRASKNSSLTR